MEVMITNVALLVLGFLGAVAAIGGDTWEKGTAPLVGRITRRGWLSILLLSLTLAVGVLKEVRAATRADISALKERDRAEMLASQLEKMQESLAAADAAAKKAEAEINGLREQLDEAQSKLDDASTQVGRLARQTQAVRKDLLIRSWERNPWRGRFQSGARLQFVEAECDYKYRARGQRDFRPRQVFLDYPPNETVEVEIELMVSSGASPLGNRPGRCAIHVIVFGSDFEVIR